MLSIEQIEHESRKAASRAAREGLYPYTVEREDLDNMPPFPFPFLGTYTPKGWKRIDTHFVDSSGFGQEGEPALTISQFKEKLVCGHGYAVYEAGEFQVKVSEYVRR